jgi:glycine/D-amino acid oxidase-like deaminating enzyme
MLATDSALLADHYDIAIIGSGYGGAITAARLGFANHQRGGTCKSRCLSVERSIPPAPSRAARENSSRKCITRS